MKELGGAWDGARFEGYKTKVGWGWIVGRTQEAVLGQVGKQEAFKPRHSNSTTTGSGTKEATSAKLVGGWLGYVPRHL